MIVSDDQGWADVSFHGGTIRTPNIDRIAHEGVELDRFYACPVCTPTRAGLVTGRYAIRFGMQRAVCRPFLDTGVPPEEDTLAEMLARAGYQARAAVGKWHIGHSRRRYHPLRQGFTFFYGHYNGNIDYFTHMREGELDWHRNFDSSDDEGYSTDLIADEAVRFIKEHAEEPPFFLYVPFNAPHLPLEVPAKWLDGYANISDPDKRTYAGMVAALDAGVGRILEALDKQGIADDTLLWFFSDNGGTRYGSNGPLRGGKGTLYEGGIRVAAALRWPSEVDGGGRKIRGLLSYLDVWPTLARAAGLEEEKDRALPLDGFDELDVLKGAADAPNRPFFSYFERYQGEDLAIIEDGWKLVRKGPPILGSNPADRPPPGMAAPELEPLTIELFHLEVDPYETDESGREGAGTSQTNAVQAARVSRPAARRRSSADDRPAAGRLEGAPAMAHDRRVGRRGGRPANSKL